MQKNEIKTALIIGATSAIATAVCRKLCPENTKMFLVGRNAERLDALKKDLLVRALIQIETYTLDFSDTTQQAEMIRTAQNFLGEIDLTLIAHGSLPNQAECQDCVAQVEAHFNTNATSVMTLLSLLTSLVYQKQAFGTIAVISSVAGERGRKSNYIYGAAKAAVTAFTSGLRAHLASNNVNVLTIKPGFVDTPMTAHIQSKGFLWASPEKVANDIMHAVQKRKSVIYTPSFWKIIIFILRHVPETIFKRLNF